MTQNKKVIAITGSIATGKSLATDILREMGYFVVDADSIAHEILEEDLILNEIKDAFGVEFFKDGKLNRKKLADYVFGNKERLEILNNITHKRVFEKINFEIKKSSEKLIFVDIPLLIELRGELYKYDFKPDMIWLIYSNKAVQLRRLMQRDSIDEVYALRKINSQMSVEEKKKYSDIVLINENSVEDLKIQILNEIEKLK
ncbi:MULTISPECIES: dephospho-CoA kinase [Peptoniphilus]|uniref:dephospho-CoA kinase n=1 Tax=Peptoniphilus TaxID=162289 RepID=UPI0001DA9AA5|nr:MULTISPECIES: dephospho-CoA kinase [Peptoniphilus]EFI41983.1 dephospho-CoA kinase [Peptoniphilus sp. oral taxon 386 str. F0131]